MIRRYARILMTAGPLLAIALAIIAPPLLAEGSQVGLVVQEGEGTINTYCIEINEPEITGYEVLARAGLDVAVVVQGGMGAGVCRIGDTGCPGNDCFCDFPPNYWSYWHLTDGQWTYSQVGAGAYRARAGGVEGWLWGRGSPPQIVTLEDICAPATNTPDPTGTATRTNSPPPPSNTATIPAASHTPEIPSPTATDSPAETMAPSATPTRALATASPTATEADLSAPPTETAQPEMRNLGAQDSSTTSYVVFGALLIGLASAAFIMRVRQR